MKAAKKKPVRKTKSVVASAPTVLVLRTCPENMVSKCGFKWPESGEVACSDWNPTPCCGYGLHGWLWGEGEGSLGYSEPAKWLVVEVLAADIVKIDDGEKVKFPRGVVVHCGDKKSATDYLIERLPKDRSYTVIGAQVSSGTRGTATAGYGGTATAGDGGTATAGTRGELRVRWWDGQRYRTGVFYVGEDGIEPNVPYRCQNGKAVKVSK